MNKLAALKKEGGEGLENSTEGWLRNVTPGKEGQVDLRKVGTL